MKSEIKNITILFEIVKLSFIFNWFVISYPAITTAAQAKKVKANLLMKRVRITNEINETPTKIARGKFLPVLIFATIGL